LITVTGTHEIQVAPDEIKITITIDNREKVAQAAKEKTDLQGKKLIQLGRAVSIEPKDVSSSFVLLQPIRNYKKAEGRSILYFQAVQRIVLTLHDFSKYQTLMDSLAQDGFAEALIEYGVSDMPGYRKKARSGAILAAQEKAKLLAETIGQKIGKAYNIKETVQTTAGMRPNVVSNAFLAENAGEGDEESGPLAVGNIPVKVSVEASFLLE